MNMVPVSSSTIKAVGYDAGSHTLRVAFVGGGVYEYVEVPAPVHDDLMAAESQDDYFDSHIQHGSYHYRQVV